MIELSYANVSQLPADVLLGFKAVLWVHEVYKIHHGLLFNNSCDHICNILQVL